MVRSNPNAPVSGAVNGAMEWADTPASSGPGLVGLEPVGQAASGQQPGKPEPGQGHRVGRHRPQRGQHLIGDRPGRARPAGPSAAGRPARRRPEGARPCRPPIGERRAALPPSSGWAKGTSGWRREWRRPSKAGWRKNGDASTRGWTAEQTSWRKPGRVDAIGAAAAPRRLGAFDHRNRETGRGQGDGGGQAVGPRSHHHHVHRAHGSDLPGQDSILQSYLWAPTRTGWRRSATEAGTPTRTCSRPGRPGRDR